MAMDILKRLHLRRRERKILKEFVHSWKTPQSLAFRAHAIVLWEEGLGIKQTGRTLGLAPATVRLWRRRWLTVSAAWTKESKTWKHAVLRKKIREVLSDHPRSGAPVRFVAEEVCQIIAHACKKPSHVGVPVSHWSARDLRQSVLDAKIVPDISVRTIGRILKKRSQTSSNEVLHGFGIQTGPDRDRSSLSHSM